MHPVRTFVFTLALILGVSGIAHAKGKHGDPAERMEKRIDKITERLDLSESQQALLREQMESMRPLMEKKMQLHGELRSKLLFEGESDATRKMQEEVLALDKQIYDSQAAFGKKLRAELSADQLTQFKELHSEKKERREERREHRRGNDE